MVPGCRAAAIRAFSVTVSPRSVSTIGRAGSIARLTVAWYIPSVALTSSPNGRSADMCGSTVRVPRLHPPAYGRSNTSSRCSRGPRNMMIERVRRAAGLVDVGQVEVGRRHDLQVVLLVEPAGSSLPGEFSTSRSRLTSSMRATRRSVVRPLLSSEAQSRATPAFLDVLTSIVPDSVVGPLTRRWVGPADPARRSRSREPRRSAPASRGRGSGGHFSIRLTALWLVFSRSASCCWV